MAVLVVHPRRQGLHLHVAPPAGLNERIISRCAGWRIEVWFAWNVSVETSRSLEGIGRRNGSGLVSRDLLRHVQ